MYCPRCGQKQKCPCKSCKNKGIVWKWIRGNFIKCGRCGFIKYADWWEDLGFQVLISKLK